ncbi:MAG TPA: MBL fold metallo-hydrolase [Gaiellaceae bacterium]|jgi:L-ascorbate metabolism protein UlaG (beta-lactamase superfamily)|nr:MBL fold metallo-hydrolase [Gaiellaceae bacterium]
MKLRWYGQSAFLLTGEQRSVFIDPFGDIAGARPADSGWSWPFPPIEGVEADLLLVTHDHLDHNGIEAIGGDPLLLDTAGTHESPVGEVVGIASEHDAVAGTQRGPNTIFRFSLDGTSVAHFGDFGQPALRPEQREALGDVDVLILPVGGGPTIAAPAAADLVRELRPALVVAMHYRTPGGLDFLDPPDAFLEALGTPVERLETSELDVEPLLGSRDEPVVALLAPPLHDA